MARNCTISPDFWTWDAVTDCKPMTRLLFIGLQNFADDGGVQPLRPRTIRLHVFPGDEVGNEAVRAMIDELAAQGLVRLYSVEGQEYVAIVDWDQLQRVGKRARRRYPSSPSLREDQGRQPSLGEKVPSVSEADERLLGATPAPDNSKPLQSPSGLRSPFSSGPPALPDIRGEKEDETSPTFGNGLRPPPLDERVHAAAA